MGVALITPFKADKSIDFEALARLIEYLIANQVDYNVVLGTTAETPALTADEQVLVRDFVIDRVNSRVPLVIGIGGNCTADVIRRINSTELSAFSAILSVVQYYNKQSLERIYQH